MPADRAGSGKTGLFGEVALGDLGVDDGAGKSGHVLDFLEPYNSAIHGGIP